MNEKVLAVPRPAIDRFLKQGFFASDGDELMEAVANSPVFLDRPDAEKDPTHKQIIPYVLIKNRGRYLVYRRTKKQGESRLHDKYSLGFGGHINDIDGNGATETNLILAAMIRELNEEIFIPFIRRVSVVGFLNDDSNPVGQVHLGVAFEAEAASDRFSVNEPENIEANWCDADAIEEIFPKLETWSQLLWKSHAKGNATSTSDSRAAQAIEGGLPIPA